MKYFFSGATKSKYDTSYLHENAGIYWALSPAIVELVHMTIESSTSNTIERQYEYLFLSSKPNNACTYLFVGGYNDFYQISMYNYAAIRPSLALKSTTTISSGNGTAASPFVVS